MGRPLSAGGRKDVEVKVRFDKDTNDKLLKYCEENKTTRTQAIRTAVDNLIDEKTKK